jgi:hypothetical protein
LFEGSLLLLTVAGTAQPWFKKYQVGLLRILRDEDTITEGDMQNIQVRFGDPRDVDAITKRDMQKINDLMGRLGASKNTYRYPNAMWRSRWSRTPFLERQCHYKDVTKSHLSFNTILSRPFSNRGLGNMCEWCCLRAGRGVVSNLES